MTQHKVSELLAAEKPNAFYVSFEFFPPKTDKGDESLMKNMVEFHKQEPIFVDFTWGAGGTTHDKTPKLCQDTAALGLVVNMHLTCTNMAEGMVHDALENCKAKNIRNLVALRGDPPAGQAWQQSKDGFACALDLVKYIRKHYGDFFSIAVAGYPEGHPEKIDPATGHCTEDAMEAELTYLKAKVDAGADFIITQLFYDNNVFFKFVKRCREVGIKVPILPGMLPMLNYGGLQRMVSLCKTYLPPQVKARVEELKENDEAFKEYGIELTTEMCKEMMAHGVHHFHFYTLNQTYSTFKVLKNLGHLKE